MGGDSLRSGRPRLASDIVVSGDKRHTALRGTTPNIYIMSREPSQHIINHCKPSINKLLLTVQQNVRAESFIITNHNKRTETKEKKEKYQRVKEEPTT